MTAKQPSILNIGLVGGGDFCREILEKTTAVYEEAEMVAPILAVADPDSASPGRTLASQLGLLTFDDDKQLYDPRYQIHLIIILTPQTEIFEKILNTHPSRIRILAYQVFRMFWKAIAQEEQKLRERTKEMETILNGIDDFILVITPDMEILAEPGRFLVATAATLVAKVIGKTVKVMSWYDNEWGFTSQMVREAAKADALA